MQKPFVATLVIPTGVGASIGGFGGDATTLLPMLSSVADWVITHPNVANAACFQDVPTNTLYVEGCALDRFFRGEWTLAPIHQNRVGIIWDSGIEPTMMWLHRNTINAVKTVYGVDIVGIETTQDPVELTLTQEPSGRSAGAINNPQVLIEAGKRLIQQGATALAVCCLMPSADGDDVETQYQSGQGIDPIAGLEAMVSHYLVDYFQLPVAHAPVFDWETAQPIVDHTVDPRSASEFMVSTFLPCVLTGLGRRAPQYCTQTTSGLSMTDVSVLIVPTNALGSVPVLACLENNIPIITVTNNTTVMSCSSDRLAPTTQNVFHCQTYLEAIGLCVALKQGITVPTHIWSSQASLASMA